MTVVESRDPAYSDEKSVRDELTRVFDVCSSCRSCVDLCVVFPTLFEMLDRLPAPDAGELTPDEQDRVVDACSRCGLCVADCLDGSVDLPRVVARAQAMRFANRQQSARRRRATRTLGRADRVGRLATGFPALANRIVGARPASLVRRLVAAVTGVSATRRLLPYASQRWSAWMRTRTRVAGRPPHARVTVYPTCVVEYQDTAFGRDLVDAFERVGVECSASAARCCGAPWLHVGDVARFSRVAARNVVALADEIRRHGDLVVAHPACAHVIRRDYPAHVAAEDAGFVAGRTHDAASYLAEVITATTPTTATTTTPTTTPTTGDAVEAGPAPSPCTSVVTAAPVDPAADDGRSLLGAVGFDVTEVRQCSGTDGLWGLRAENDATVGELGSRLRGRVPPGGAVVADGPLAAALVAEDGGPLAVGPFHLVARRLGPGPHH